MKKDLSKAFKEIIMGNSDCWDECSPSGFCLCEMTVDQLFEAIEADGQREET